MRDREDNGSGEKKLLGDPEPGGSSPFIGGRRAGTRGAGGRKKEGGKEKRDGERRQGNLKKGRERGVRIFYAHGWDDILSFRQIWIVFSLFFVFRAGARRGARCEWRRKAGGMPGKVFKRGARGCIPGPSPGGLEERETEEGIVSGKRGRAGGYFSPGGAEKVRERLCFLMKA